MRYCVEQWSPAPAGSVKDILDKTIIVTLVLYGRSPLFSFPFYATTRASLESCKIRELSLCEASYRLLFYFHLLVSLPYGAERRIAVLVPLDASTHLFIS